MISLWSRCSVCETPINQCLPFEDNLSWRITSKLVLQSFDSSSSKMLLRFVIPILLLSGIGTEGKKKKAKKTSLFDSKTLNCLVCRWLFALVGSDFIALAVFLLLPVYTHFLKFRSLVEEIEGMIYQVEKMLVWKSFYLFLPRLILKRKWRLAPSG